MMKTAPRFARSGKKGARGSFRRYLVIRPGHLIEAGRPARSRFKTGRERVDDDTQ